MPALTVWFWTCPTNFGSSRSPWSAVDDPRADTNIEGSVNMGMGIGMGMHEMIIEEGCSGFWGFVLARIMSAVAARGEVA